MSTAATKYLCMRCNNYETRIFNDIKKHCLKIKSCSKRSDIILLSDDQLIVLTLIPYYNNKHLINIHETEHLSESNIISEHKQELYYELNDIFKNKLRKCKYCDFKFDTLIDLRKHIITYCFYNTLKKNYTTNGINNCIISNLNNTTNNISRDLINNNNCEINNNCNINNSNSNYNLFFNLPTPFENAWDISEISNTVKNDIIVSQFMFSKLLTEILSNEKNLNVILNKDDTEYGKVYINHKKQYVEMAKKEILMETMDKLYDQLFDIVEDNKDSLKSIKQLSMDYIHEKFNRYCKDNENKNDINDVLIETYDKYSDSAIKKSEQIDYLNKNKSKVRDNINIKSNDNNIKRNKNIIRYRKELFDTIMASRDEDLYYTYDSDGNTKI